MWMIYNYMSNIMYYLECIKNHLEKYRKSLTNYHKIKPP